MKEANGMNEDLAAKLDQYIAAHIEAEPDELHSLWRRTHLRHLYPRMCSGHVQGRVLAMIAWMLRPQRVLELGTFTGYSALCLAEGMPEGGILDTVEIDDEMESELHDTFASCPRPAQIRLHIGDALDVVPRLEGKWDLVFIDADKRRYCDYFELVAERLNPGGFILADNTLWSGKAAAGARDVQSRGIEAFNDMVAADPRFATVILPLRDGLTLIRRR